MHLRTHEPEPEHPAPEHPRTLFGAVYVVDGSSTDGLLDVARELRRVEIMGRVTSRSI
jgi:hypothetical protein